MQKAELLSQIIQMARPLTQQSNAAVAHMLSGSTLTVRMRAVLEALEELGASTVPGIARHLGIQRQYVQVMMNEIEAASLVKRLPNPGHKRSDLFELADGGRGVIKGIRQAERSVTDSLARRFTMDEVEKAHHVIEHLADELAKLNKSLAE